MENKLKIAVVGMIDNSIRRALENKKSLDDIICELNERSNSNFRVIGRERRKKIAELSKEKIDHTFITIS